MSDLWGIVLKVGLSALLGGAIGAEREHTGKWAGLRTHMLIAVGAALLTDVSISIGAVHGPVQGWDPGRIAAQIVSGLGFIGAGTIIQSRGAVHGLTTAAGLWVAGAIGLAVGGGFYDEAVVTTIALLVILAALRPVAKWLSDGHQQILALELQREDQLSELMKALEAADIETETLTVAKPVAPEGPRAVVVRFRGSDADRERLVAEVRRRRFVDLEEDR